MNLIHEQIYREIISANRIVLVAHKNPDGDTLGAATGLLYWLDGIGKPAVPFCASDIPEEYDFLYGVRRFSADPRVFTSADLVCVLDAGSLGHAGVGDYLNESDRARIINIDHHAVNDKFGTINLVESLASSTSEIIYRLVKGFGIRFCAEPATSLLTGIITDTSFFVNAATSTEAMAAAGELLQAGAEYNRIHQRLFKNKSLSALGIWGAALSRLRYNPEYGVATTVIKYSDFNGAEDEEAMEGLTNYLCATLKAPVILALREIGDGKIKGSLRTVEDIDVAAFAKALGGGGHKKAAGFTIDGHLEENENGWSVV